MVPFSSKIEIALRDELHSYIGPRYSARQVTRSVMGFRRLTPQFCSIYDPHFWRHERLWKLLGGAAFNGTPFKSVIWRLFGVKIGKRVYDAGLNMPEKTLVTIGDECTFNEGNHVQGHSLEDGTFKTDYIVIGNRCTFGVDGWVNYGVNMRDGSSLGADAMLMKGEDIPQGATFSGNPAREVVVPAAGCQRPLEIAGGPRHRTYEAAAGTAKPVHGVHGKPRAAHRQRKSALTGS